MDKEEWDTRTNAIKWALGRIAEELDNRDKKDNPESQPTSP